MTLTERISALDAAIDKLNAEMAAMEEKADAENDGLMSEDEKAAYDRLGEQLSANIRERDECVAQHNSRVERANAAAARKKEPLPRLTPDASNAPLPGNDPEEPRERQPAGPWRIPAQVRYHSCQNITGTVNGRSAEERAYRLGMFALAKASLDCPHRYRGAAFERAKQFVADQWAVHYSGDSNGSHTLVPDEFATDIIDLRKQYGVVRRLFQTEPMSSETKIVPRQTGNVTAYFVGPNSAGTESNMSHDSVNLTAKKLMVLSRVAKDLSMDSVIALGDRLARDIAWAMAKKEDECGLLGDGTSTYGGIVGATTKLSGKAGLVTGSGNAYSELTIGDFHNVLAKLPSYARLSAARWVVSPTFFFTVMQRLEVALGGTSMIDVAGMQSGNGAYRFLGIPVEFSDAMPSTEANSQVCALLGDWQLGAIFGDRAGVEIEFDDTVVIGGVSVWERDEIGVKGVERFDINVHDVGDATTPGAIVGLATAAS